MMKLSFSRWVNTLKVINLNLLKRNFRLECTNNMVHVLEMILSYMIMLINQKGVGQIFQTAIEAEIKNMLMTKRLFSNSLELMIILRNLTCLNGKYIWSVLMQMSNYKQVSCKNTEIYDSLSFYKNDSYKHQSTLIGNIKFSYYCRIFVKLFL